METNPARTGSARMTLLDFTLPQIASGDFDIAVVSQVAATKFTLSDEFEPGPVKAIGFEASFRCRGSWKQDLEHASENPHHTLIFTHADAELDGVSVGVPPGVRGKTEEHVPPGYVPRMFTEHGM